MNEDMKKRLEKICSSIGKRYENSDGTPGVTYVGNTTAQPLERFSSGSITVDDILGGGWPRGRIVEIYGGEAVGKTTIVCHAIAEFQKKYPGEFVAIIDSEFTFDREYAEVLGVDVDSLILCQPETGEMAFNVIDSLIEEKVGLIIVDSVAALASAAERKKEAGESTVGEQARLMSSQLRKLVSKVAMSKSCMLFTNQQREKIGISFGDNKTTPGGQALKYYSSIRLLLVRTGSEKEGEVAVANTVKATTKKNKTFSPFKSAEFSIVFGEGIDNEAGIVNEAVDLDLIKKSGAWFVYKDEKYQGKKNVVLLLKSDEKLRDELIEEIKRIKKEKKDLVVARNKAKFSKMIENAQKEKSTQEVEVKGKRGRKPKTEVEEVEETDEEEQEIEDNAEILEGEEISTVIEDI